MIAHNSRPTAPAFIEDRSLRTGHIKRYKVKGHLGKGGFANVYRVQSIDSCKIYACKIINKSKLVSSEHQRKLVSEIQLHRDLSHPNIVRFDRHFEDKKNVYILLECCANGSLMALSMRRVKLTEPEVRYFMKEILIAIQFLHSKFIIHRDLKLGNILLDKNLTVKICDFGLAAKLQFDSERKTTICGTPNYTAPEILNQRKSGEGHSYEVDIWAIGVIMFTLLTGKPPFETRNIKETYRRIKRIKYQWPTGSDRYISAQAKNLISQVFMKDPDQRPDLKHMAEHPFFSELPIPQSLPHSILKQIPAMKDLFGETYSPNAQTQSTHNPRGRDRESSRSRDREDAFDREQPQRSRDREDDHKDNSSNGSCSSKSSSFQDHAQYGRSNSWGAPTTSAATNSSREPLSSRDYTGGQNQVQQREQPVRRSLGAENQNVNSNGNRFGGQNQHDRNDRNDPQKPSKGQPETACDIDGGLKPNRTRESMLTVLKFVNYTKKYGMGYILSSGATGIYFNDSTKIVLHQNKHNVMYVDADNCQQCSISSYPHVLRKKVTLLKHFTDYLWRPEDPKEDENGEVIQERNQLIKALAAKIKGAAKKEIGSMNEEETVYVQNTCTDQYCVLFKLSDNTVQVDFTDTSKIIIKGSTVKYRNKKGVADDYRLSKLFSSNKKDLKKRCKYTQQLLQKIAAEERRQE